MKLSKTAYDDQTLSSAQTVASIDDILIQIFLCIPLKPLFRLKLVSKHWNFIISGKTFNSLRNQNPNPPVGLIFTVTDQCLRSSSYVVSFDKPTTGPPFRTLEFNSRWLNYATLDSCNGLLLCTRIDCAIDDPNRRYYVCNPTTNKYLKLPKIGETPSLYRMSLAFDPSKSPHYKVVCVVTATGVVGYPIYLEVYSSETGCWIKHSEPFSGRANFGRGVYWNGAIHWISTTNTGKSLYFNPDNDRVPQVMPTPPMITEVEPYDLDWSYNHSYFGESCGHLHYIEDYKRVMELNVYEMRTDYSEWFVKYRVDCSLIDNRLVSVICVLVRGKKDEDSFLVLQSEKRIIRHNLVNKNCETIRELDAAGISFYQHPLQYIESLSHV